MTDLPMLLINLGLLIATAAATVATLVATGFSIWRGFAAQKAERGAIGAQNAAQSHAVSAGIQASAAVGAAGSALRQASAAEHSSLSARRQAEAAESALTQSDTFRSDDRQADAILGLVSMLYREVELASAGTLWQSRAFHRFSNGERLIRAYTLLPPDLHPVAHWASTQRDEIMDYVDRARGEVDSGRVGANQSRAAETAANAAQELLKWRRGERDTASFQAELDGR